MLGTNGRSDGGRAHRARRSTRTRGLAVACVVTLAVVGSGLVARDTVAGAVQSVAGSTSPDDAVGPVAAEATGGVEEVRAVVAAPQQVLAGPVINRMTDRQLRRLAERNAALEQAKEDAQPYEFTIASFNVLGSQHSAPGGDHAKYPAASSRSVGAADYIKRYGVDMVGTQELQPDQLEAITRYTGFAAFPGYAFGSQDTDNSILYDPDLFELVEGTSFSITFMNAVRPQTVARFEERKTGREFWVVNMHASAGEGKYAASRAAGHNAAIAEVNELKADGLPVFITGDMNDREEFFCRFAPATGMNAAIGGDVDGGCHPARALGVDWILATPDVELSGYVEDRSTLGRVSDHHFFASDVLVPAKANPFAKSRQKNRAG